MAHNKLVGLPHACHSKRSGGGGDDVLRRLVRAFFLGTILASGIIVQRQPAAMGLTAEERSELARKFKYYHRTVRPTLELNLLDTINGTFFRLVTELELQSTFHPPEGPQNRLIVDFALFVHYRDDRLLLRDLANPMTIPDEFQPWMPRVQPLPMEMAHGLLAQKTATFEPRTGHLTAIFRFYGAMRCDFEAWKMPFEQYKCYFWLETDPDERLSLRTLRDLRPNWQIRHTKIGIEHWPFLTLTFHFKSHRWQHLLVSAYLPSLLLFLCAVLAQWRRRKIQVVVTMGTLLAILILFHQQSSQSVHILHQQIASSSPASLLDFWFGGVFIHLICLLCLDLLLPARHVLVFKKGVSPTTRRAICNSLAASLQKGKALSSSQPLYSSSSPHYVSSTHLHMPPLPPRAAANATTTAHSTIFQQKHRHIMPSPGQLIRTFSVPPRRLVAQVPAASRGAVVAPVGGTMPTAAQTEPLQRRMTTTTITAPAPLSRADSSGEQRRAQRIATLLAEMEGIRQRETDEDDGPSSLLRHADSVIAVDDDEQLLLHASDEVLIKSSTSPAPVEPHKPATSVVVGNGGTNLMALNTCAMRRRFPSSFPTAGAAADHRNSGTPDSELGRAEGMPRRKKVLLGLVTLSFCFFCTTYVALVALVMLNLVSSNF